MRGVIARPVQRVHRLRVGRRDAGPGAVRPSWERLGAPVTEGSQAPGVLVDEHEPSRRRQRRPDGLDRPGQPWPPAVSDPAAGVRWAGRACGAQRTRDTGALVVEAQLVCEHVGEGQVPPPVVRVHPVAAQRLDVSGHRPHEGRDLEEQRVRPDAEGLLVHGEDPLQQPPGEGVPGGRGEPHGGGSLLAYLRPEVAVGKRPSRSGDERAGLDAGRVDRPQRPVGLRDAGILEQPGHRGRGVRFQHVVRVQEHHRLAGRAREAVVERGSLATVVRQDGGDPVAVRRDDGTRVVGGAVVDDHDLDGRIGLRERAVEAGAQEPGVVEVRDDDADRRHASFTTRVRSVWATSTPSSPSSGSSHG